MPGKPRQVADVELGPKIPSESRNWPDEDLQGQAVHAKNWRFFQQKHYFIAKELMWKIITKEIQMSILDRFLKQLGVSHSPEQPERYTNLLQLAFRQCRQFAIVLINRNWRWVIISVFLWHLGKTTDVLICRRSQQRSDHRNAHSVVSGMACMNKEAGQNPQIACRDDLNPEKLDWLIWLSYNWKWYFAMNQTQTQTPHKDITKNQKTSMPRETEKHSLINLMIGGKQICGTSPGGQNQDGHGEMKSEGFFFNSGVVRNQAKNGIIFPRWSWSDAFVLCSKGSSAPT